MGPYDTEGMPGGDASATETDSQTTADKPDDSEAGPEGVTALLPKSICPGMDLKPGDEIKLKVEKVLEDEVEVSYEKGDEAEPSEMAKSESKLDEMSEPAPS